MPSTEERLATIEEALRNVHSDLREQRESGREDHHRLRAVEAAVKQLVDGAAFGAETVAKRQRRIEVRIQVLTAVIAGIALLEPFLYGWAHH